MIENDHHDSDADVVHALAEALDCQPDYLVGPSAELSFDRPKLRAYADASQKTVDRTVFDSVTAVETIRATDLRTLDVRLPLFDGDANDDAEIDRIAADTRSAAGLSTDEVIPNVIRSAERLGCVVLPLDDELGRHWGMSLTIDRVPVIRVKRPSLDPEADIPGDRQRFTVAHELGHLILHAAIGQPTAPSDAAKLEQQANRFAAAFLVPGDVLLSDLAKLGGRVTLGTLAKLKQKWAYSVKAFVFRFQSLGVIDEGQARSLYKQISARKWNKEEPYRPGTETAVWMSRALSERFPGSSTAKDASLKARLGAGHVRRWLDWSPSGRAPSDAIITTFRPASKSRFPKLGGTGSVSRLPRRP